PAAPTLRGRLKGTARGPLRLPYSLDPDVEILRALSRIGSSEDVAAAAAILADPARSGPVRRQALALLAGLRTPAATRATDKLFSSARRRTRWKPPAPPADPVEPSPHDLDLDEPVGLEASLARWNPIRSAHVPLPDGGELIVFADGSLGK